MRLAALLGKYLVANLVAERVHLVPQKRLEAAIGRRAEPEDGVDQVHPDGHLHDGHAGTLVGVVALPLEEDAGKDAKDDHPADPQGRVPPKGAVRLEHLEEAADDGDGAGQPRGQEGDGGEGGAAGDDDGKKPLGRNGLAALAVRVDAVAVEADGDDGEDELQRAHDDARNHLKALEPRLAHRLARVGALAHGKAPSVAAHLPLVGLAKVVGVTDGLGGAHAKFDRFSSLIHVKYSMEMLN